MPKNGLVNQVVGVSQEYLGPAAERFVHRQIYTHIGKKPADLDRHDLAQLADWLKLSFALISDDSKLVEDYAAQLNSIVEGQA